MKNAFLLLAILLMWYNQSFAQSNQPGRLIHQDLQREYIVHLPTGYTGQEQLPIIIFLHGGSGSAQSAMGFTLMNSISNLEGFLVAYPQGIGPVDGGGFSWADGRGTSADALNIDDVGFVDKLIDSLSITYPIDSNRIYLSGFSNGGFMTQRIACEMPERFAAMASLGASMSLELAANCAPEKAIPMFIINGTADQFVPFNGGPSGVVGPIIPTFDLVDFWKNNNGCTTILDSLELPDLDPSEESTITSFGFTNCACEADVQLYRVNNGGHTWPGVENTNYEMIAGETNEDIQASFELWRFFEQYERCAEVTSTSSIAVNSKWKISPNPGRNVLIIEHEDYDNPKRVQLHTINGALVSDQRQPQKGSLDVAHLAPGLYLISIWASDGTLSIHKWMKQ